MRFHEILLGWHNSFYVFGLIRVSALKQTKLILPHTHGDTILIARLILLGRFQQVSEYLFKSRRHAAQSNEIYKVEVPCGLDTDAYASWYDTQGMSRPKYPNWRILSEFNQTLKDVDVSWLDRMICRMYIGRFGLRHIHCLLWDLGGLPRRFVAVTSALFLKKKYTVERKSA